MTPFLHFIVPASAGETITNKDIEAFLGTQKKDSPSQSEKVVRRPPAKSAEQLAAEYQNNPIAADATYKGRFLTVGGTIQNIGRDILGRPYLVLGGSGPSGDVQCVFTKEEEPSITKLSKGEYVTVRGEVSGKMVFVILGKCEFKG
jgi:tRNA_anti-like